MPFLRLVQETSLKIEETKVSTELLIIEVGYFFYSI